MTFTPHSTDGHSLDDWITEISESQGRSESEVLQQIMSSYWILAELSGMVQDAEFDGAGTAGKPPVRPATESPADAPDGSTAADTDDITIDRTFLEFLTKLADQTTDSSSGGGDTEAAHLDAASILTALATDQGSPNTATPSGADPALDEVLERITRPEAHRVHEGTDHPSDDHALDASGAVRPAAAAADSALTRRLDALAEQLDAITATLMTPAEGDDTGDEPAEAELRDTIQNLQGQLDTLSAALEDRASREAVETLATQLRSVDESVETVEAELSSDVRALDSRLDESLETVEQILQHLVEHTDEHATHLQSLFDAYDELRPAAELVTARRELADLTAAANRQGVETATCKSCKNTVSVGLLTTCTCPHCNRHFTGVSMESRLWRTRATLETTATSSQFGSGRTTDERSPRPTADSEPRPSPNETTRTRSAFGFEWFSREW